MYLWCAEVTLDLDIDWQIDIHCAYITNLILVGH